MNRGTYTGGGGELLQLFMANVPEMDKLRVK